MGDASLIRGYLSYCAAVVDGWWWCWLLLLVLLVKAVYTYSLKVRIAGAARQWPRAHLASFSAHLYGAPSARLQVARISGWARHAIDGFGWRRGRSTPRCAELPEATSTTTIYI